MISAVDTAEPPNRDHQESSNGTLGALLYANKAKVPVSEKDWVRMVEAIATGDQLALHLLYEKIHRIVFTLIVRITKSRETAEELTIDVFHDVWRRAAAYDPTDGSVVGWIMNQARSRAIDRLRFEQRKKRTPNTGENPLNATVTADPQHAYHLEEQSRLVRTALKILTLEEREAIETAFFSELTYSEVALKLNQPVGTVKTRIRSGLGKLRQTLLGTLKGI